MRAVKDSNIASRLGNAIQSAALSRKALAAESGVSEPSISQYLSKAREPTVDNLVRLATALNVSADYLLGLSDVQTPDADLQAINRITGLSEQAITTLQKRKQQSSSFSRVISNIIWATDKTLTAQEIQEMLEETQL